MPKVGKSSHCHQNFINSEDDHDTPACQISDHSFHSFSLEYSKPQFHYFFFATRGPNWAKIKSVLNVVMIHLHAKFQAIPSTCDQNARKFFGHQRAEMGPILAKIKLLLEVVRIHQHALFQAIPSMRSA